MTLEVIKENQCLAVYSTSSKTTSVLDQFNEVVQCSEAGKFLSNT